MIEVVLACVVVFALIGIAIILFHNKFQISIVKMEEAENNIDLFLQRKLGLLKRAKQVIAKELKLEEFLEPLDSETITDLNHFELNDL